MTSQTHPILHYELNEAWVFSSAGDIAPETTGGVVKSYSENYSGGGLKTEWGARITPGGRYLLHGTQTSYYRNGTRQHRVTYENGRPSGIETYWLRDGTRLWSWHHNPADNTAVWTHYYSNGLKKLQSHWRTYGPARDSSRNFLGLIADGPVYHWNECGSPTYGSGGPQNKTADLDGDGRTGGHDLSLMGYNWLWSGPAGCYNIADLDQDGDVDFKDFAAMAANF
jgi:hypothetical protein